MLNIFEKLRRFDAYPKTLEDVRIKTYGGAVVSIISLIIMSLLFWVELIDYLTPNVSEDLFVDTSRSPTIQINLDIIVPTISCDFLALDAMDSSGEQHLQIDHNIYKRRLDLKGQPIEEPKKEDIIIQSKNSTEVATTSNKTECGSCYGASFDPKRCCNTCEDVREAYRERRWAFPENPENITQCKEEKFSEKLKTAFAQGCQIYGSLTVNRVSGSFHIAPGKSFSINHVHVHDVQPFSSTEFNTTHRIRHLSFGASIDSDSHNPLKDTVGLAEEGMLLVDVPQPRLLIVVYLLTNEMQAITKFCTFRKLFWPRIIGHLTYLYVPSGKFVGPFCATMFQYHIKIVPTAYVKKDGEIINANQFSVTKHRKVISIMSGESGMPGIFFQYELSPLMVKYTERSRSFGHFATNVCAIIGGVYTVAGLIDTLLYHSVKLIQKKIELGKFH